MVPAVESEQQRIGQEIEAARVSKLFASTGIRELALPSVPVRFTRGRHAKSGGSAAQSSGDETFAQNGQDRKLAFVNASIDRRTTSPDRIAAPASSYVVQAGNVIPASLITGIRSDLPGQITAQVTENVYDSPTGRFRLIPQGARLIGVYDSQVAFGQSRVLAGLDPPDHAQWPIDRTGTSAWRRYRRLCRSRGWGRQSLGRLFKAALLSTLLGVGSELGSSGQDNDIVQALRRGASDSANQTGQQIVRRNLNIQPTLTIRPGLPVRVIVNRDLVLEPYKG